MSETCPRDDQNVKKILVTGGCGYLGSTMVPMLLAQGYEVTVYDMFRWGISSLLPVMDNANLTIVKGDVTDHENLRPYVEACDGVIHLSAIVGYPACKKEPEAAVAINQTSTEFIASILKPTEKMKKLKREKSFFFHFRLVFLIFLYSTNDLRLYRKLLRSCHWSL